MATENDQRDPVPAQLRKAARRAVDRASKLDRENERLRLENEMLRGVGIRVGDSLVRGEELLERAKTIREARAKVAAERKAKEAAAERAREAPTPPSTNGNGNSGATLRKDAMTMLQRRAEATAARAKRRVNPLPVPPRPGAAPEREKTTMFVRGVDAAALLQGELGRS